LRGAYFSSLLVGLPELGVGALRCRQHGRCRPGEDQKCRVCEKYREILLSDIEKENTRVFVVDAAEKEGPSTVVLLFTDYLRDRTMAEISHKEYWLLGKVVRKIESASDDPIDLLRGTGLGGVGRETLEPLLGALSTMDKMNLPQVSPEVLGPALEVVPIAIYV
jgi:hypothetical protein